MDITRSGHEPVYCTIVPPHLLDRLSQAENQAVAGAALRTLRQRSGRHPVEITGTIETNGPTEVRWRFETQQGGAMPNQAKKHTKNASHVM